MTQQIITIITPHFMNRPKRKMVDQFLDKAMAAGHAVRWNGNGGISQNMPIDSTNFADFLPTVEFMGLTQKIPAPTADHIKAAIKIASRSIPRAGDLPKEDKLKLSASVHSIYGYSGRISDLIVIVPDSRNKHNNDEHLYDDAIKIAKASGAPIKTLK